MTGATLPTMDNKVRQVVSNIQNLPTPPIVFNQIQKVINDPHASAAQVAAVLAEDPAMSVKVLKLTNSAFYGLAREVDSVKQAVVIVGMEAVKNLVLSASVLDMFKSNDLDTEYQDAFWRHSLATAFCCRLLARRLKSRGMVDPDALFSAGLLHDIGKLIVCCFLPEDHEKLQASRAADETTPDFQVEQASLGYHHGQIGGFLATKWKLPGKLSDAIAFHHHPGESESETPVAYIVYLGNYVAKRTFFDLSQQELIGPLDKSVAEYMGVTDEDLEDFSSQLREEYVKAETFMQMAGLGG